MSCHSCVYSKTCETKPLCGLLSTQKCKILLVGNPNVGKSALFSRITGAYAVSSNYPGSTVGFMEGIIKTRSSEQCRIIDVPGAYTLTPTNEAEAVAQKIVEEGADAAIIVIDATALERNLVLALEVMERSLPCVIALNMIDEARHKGVSVDIEKLEEILGVPVIPTVAVAGQGISELVDGLNRAQVSKFTQPLSKAERWAAIGQIAEAVQQVRHRHHTFLDRLEDASVDKFWGVVLGVLVLGAGFTCVRFLGEGLIAHIFDPFFENIVRPLLDALSAALGAGILRDILIGKLFDGAIDFEQSFGLLTTGAYVEFAMVLPYIIAFYAILGLLEDSGYLPRLAVLFDALLHPFGIHGYAIIPTLLGMGCNVPGILATRVLESKRERFIAVTLISVAVPCTALQAMIIGALGGAGVGYVALVYLVMLMAWVILGRVMHKMTPGFSPELIVEIPPYRVPLLSSFAVKLWLRVKDFLVEATPLVLGGILVINVLDMLGFMDFLAKIFGPLFGSLLGLPAKTAGPIVMGIFRKDIAVGLLLPLNLTTQQLTVSIVMLAMTFPCIATIIIVFKELGLKDGLKSISLSLICALSAGTLLNLAFKMLG